MSVKRGRGRPRKNETKRSDLPKVSSNNNNDLGIIKNAVVEASRRRPRRAASSVRKIETDPELQAIQFYGEEDDDDDEDEDEFVPEFDVDEEKQRRNKKRRGRSVQASSEGSSKSQRGYHPERKGKIIRALKDLSSARDKIERIYGFNENKLLKLAKVKEAFEPYLFCFPLDIIQPNSVYYVNCIPPCALENVYDRIMPSAASRLKTFHDINSREFEEMFVKNRKERKVVINELETALQSEQLMEFPVLPYGKREGFVYNSGGFITDLAWLAQDEFEDQYLAVALSQYFESPSDSHLRMFDSESHTACIEIFKLNPHTLQFTKVQTLVHSFGEIWNLKWHEGCKKNGILGVLAFVSQEGFFKLMEVSIPFEDLPIIRLIDEAPVSVSMPNTNITCYDFLSPTTIICGFKNGFVGEFDLTDPETPSYYHKMHDSYVISICAAYSEMERLTVGTLSVDGYFYIFDPKEIFTSKLEVARFRGTNIIPISYLPQLYAFVHSDGTNSLKTVVPRASFGIHTISLQETTIVSVATSRLHPLVLNGSSDGNVSIDNVARRILTGIKNSSIAHCSLRLWKWEYNKQEDKYRLNHNYEIYKPSINEVSGVKIDAHGVNISCIKWNETSAAGQFYAFANSAGLLTIERLTNN